MSIIENMTRRNGRRAEPMLEPLPTADEDSPEVRAFLEKSKSVRDERNLYRDQCGHLSNELRLANERLAALTAELKDVKHDRDFYQRHSISIAKSLHNIKLLIDMEVAEAARRAVPEPETETQGREDSAAAVEAAIAEIQEAQN